MSRYNPIHYVPQAKVRVLLVATTKDTLCNINMARRAATLNPLVRLVEKDAGEWLSLVPIVSYLHALGSQASGNQQQV